MAERLDFNLAPVPACRRSRPNLALHFAPVERFERRKLFIGKCILGICQDHDVKGTSLVLPCTQGHAKFEMTFRGCLRNAKNDYSRIRTATRSNCSFLCLFIRQVARLVFQGNIQILRLRS